MLPEKLQLTAIECEQLCLFNSAVAPIFVLRLNHDGVIQANNAFAESISGCLLHGTHFRDVLICFQGELNWEALHQEILTATPARHFWNIKTIDNLPLELQFEFFLNDDSILALAAPNVEELLHLRRTFLDLQKEWHATSRESLKHSYLEQEHLERHHRLLLSALGEGVIGLDVHGNHSFVNPAAATMLGFDKKELSGKPFCSAWRHLKADGSLHTESPLLDVLKTGESYSHAGEFFTRKDGSFFPVEYVCTPLIERKHITGAVLIFRNITERLATQNKLRQQHEELAELNAHLEQRVYERTLQLEESNEALAKAKDAADAANQAKSQFLATMSHELRTPLNAILGFTQLLTRSTNLNPQEREYLSISHRSGQHLLGLINTVLELAKIEAGRIVLNSARVNLFNLLEDIMAMFRLRAEEKSLYLRLIRDPEIPRYVITDEGRIRQILLNLLSNAIKFTDSGGIEVRVTGELQDGKVFLRIEVQDTGVGLSDEEISHLFKSFEQTEEGRKREGTGLGLVVSREYAQLMGGDIFVRGVLGVGSTFVFTCPMEIGSSEISDSSKTKGMVVGLADDERARRILVVDDNSANRLFLRSLLQTIGFEVREAANAIEAILTCRSGWAEMVFMDIKMPEIDGLEATRRIRKNETVGQHIPIIALSASAFEEERERIVAAGCDAFIHKPIDETHFFEIIGSCLKVNYRYQELLTASEKTDALTPASLRHIPKVLRANLLEALVELDTEKVESLLQELEKTEPKLSAAMLEMAQAFQYKELVELFEVVEV